MSSADAISNIAVPGFEAFLGVDQAVLEAIPAAVYVCSADGVVVRFNRRATELWGRTPRPGDTAEQFCGSFRLYELDGRPLPHAETPMETVLRTGIPEHDKEIVVERPDGSRVVVLVTIEPLFGASGRVQGAINCFQDISARRQAEAQRDLLVAELSHRVKNTLATVISIARQSFAKGPSIKEARSSFDGRILALAQTHGRLAEENWSGVPFEIVLLDEFAPYRRLDGGNIKMSGPSIVLNPKCALVLGMAFHELATNAAKYGALSTTTGVVNVTWVVQADRQLAIHWVESGGPEVRPPRRSGFGRLLLERALASDLRGVGKLDFAGGELRCDITVPLDGHVACVNLGLPLRAPQGLA